MGLFSRKPSRTEQAKWVAVSQKILPFFLRLAQSGSVKFKDGRTVDFTVSDHRSHVLFAVQTMLVELRLNDFPPYSVQALVDRAKLIHDRGHATTYEQDGPIGETALNIVEGLNVHEMLSFSYYEQYPQFEPLREMISNHVKVIVPALDPIFEEGLPDYIRLTFPKFTEHYAQIRGGSVGGG